MIVTQDGGSAKLTYKTTPDSRPSLHTPNVHTILAAIDTDKPITISGPMSVVPITSATFNPTSWPDALQISDDTIVQLLNDYPFPIPYNSLTFSDTSVLTHPNKNKHFNFLGYITATSISNNSTLVYANLDMFGQPAKVRPAAASAPTHVHYNKRITTAPHCGCSTAPATHTACPTKCRQQSIPSTPLQPLHPRQFSHPLPDLTLTLPLTQAQFWAKHCRSNVTASSKAITFAYPPSITDLLNKLRPGTWLAILAGQVNSTLPPHFTPPLNSAQCPPSCAASPCATTCIAHTQPTNTPCHHTMLHLPLPAATFLAHLLFASNTSHHHTALHHTVTPTTRPLQHVRMHLSSCENHSTNTNLLHTAPPPAPLNNHSNH
jgi:hypothetical protein